MDSLFPHADIFPTGTPQMNAASSHRKERVFKTLRGSITRLMKAINSFIRQRQYCLKAVNIVQSDVGNRLLSEAHWIKAPLHSAETKAKQRAIFLWGFIIYGKAVLTIP